MSSAKHTHTCILFQRCRCKDNQNRFGWIGPTSQQEEDNMMPAVASYQNHLFFWIAKLEKKKMTENKMQGKRALIGIQLWFKQRLITSQQPVRSAMIVWWLFGVVLIGPLNDLVCRIFCIRCRLHNCLLASCLSLSSLFIQKNKIAV